MMSLAMQSRERVRREQMRHTALLIRLSIELRESLDAAQITRDILQAIINNTDAKSASMFLVGSEDAIDLAYEIDHEQLRLVPADRATATIKYGLAGWALRNGRHVVLGDISRDERWYAFEGMRSGSAMCLLLSYNRTHFGVLTVTHPDRDHFTSSDLILLEGVTALAGVALSAAQRYAEERRYREQALLLFSMTQFLTARRSIEDMAGELLDKSVAVLSVPYTAIYQCPDEEHPPELLAARIDDAQLSDESTIDQVVARLAEQAWSSREMAIGHYQPSETAHYSCLAMPMLHHGAILGAFVIMHEADDRTMRPSRLWSLFTIFTNVVAAAFSSARLFEQLQLRNDSLEQLVKLRTIQLQQSRDLLRVIFDNLPDGLLLIDSADTVLATNRVFAHTILGQPPQRIIGQKLATVLAQHPLLVSEPHPTSEQIRRYRYVDQDGKEHWCDVDRYPAADLAGQAGNIERWRDVTEQEDLHRKLLVHTQLSTMGRLAASVVHELGNPLQSVRSCLNLCREDPRISVETAEYLDVADSELERLAHLLERWRDLYRPAQLTWQEVALNELLRRMEQLTSQQLDRYGITLELLLDPNLPKIIAQPDALRQVILNLLLNAQEAMPQGGTIQIKTETDREQSHVFLRISDTGVGIKPELLRQIGEPFQSSQPQKLGLGLYLSHQIIQRHRGILDIRSTPMKGTTITISLPKNEEHYA